MNLWLKTFGMVSPISYVFAPRMLLYKARQFCGFNSCFQPSSSRYLKNGPSNLEKYMERRFGYALSGEDIENAVLGGPQEMNTVIIQWYRNTKRHVLLIRFVGYTFQ